MRSRRPARPHRRRSRVSRARTPRRRKRRRTHRRAPSQRAPRPDARGAGDLPRASPRRSAPALAPKASELGNELVAPELEEGLLVRADVMEVGVRVPRLVVLLDLLEVLLGIRSERQRPFQLVGIALLR